MNNTFTLHFNLNDPENPLKILQQTYRHFLGFEHSTGQKELWLEQKKVYDEIFNAEDPLKAAIEFKNLGKRTSEIAAERIAMRK